MTETHPHLSVGGHWIAGVFTEDSPSRSAVTSPVTGALVATVPSGTAVDVDAAVAAGRAALPGWSSWSPLSRAEALERMAAELTARNEEIAQAITAEIGVPISLSRAAQAALPPAVAVATAQ